MAPEKSDYTRSITGDGALELRAIRVGQKIGGACAVLTCDPQEIVDQHNARMALLGAAQEQAAHLGPALGNRLEGADHLALYALDYIEAQSD